MTRAKSVARIVVRQSGRPEVVASARCTSSDPLAVLRVSQAVMGVARELVRRGRVAPGGGALYVDVREVAAARKREARELERVAGWAGFLGRQIRARLLELAA